MTAPLFASCRRIEILLLSGVLLTPPVVGSAAEAMAGPIPASALLANATASALSDGTNDESGAANGVSAFGSAITVAHKVAVRLSRPLRLAVLTSTAIPVFTP